MTRIKNHLGYEDEGGKIKKKNEKFGKVHCSQPETTIFKYKNTLPYCTAINHNLDMIFTKNDTIHWSTFI